MHSERFITQRLHNILHSAALLFALIALLCLLGWSLAGVYGILWAVLLGVVPLYVSLRIHPFLILKMYRARELSASEAPEYFALAAELGNRAGLPTRPHLFHIPSQAALVFSVGRGERSAIAITGGMLQLLSQRELVGVLAHEMSHIRNNDTWVMSFADVVSRLTNTISVLGQLLILLNLPLYLLSDHALPWIPLLIMLVAPVASAMMQLALSRTREFDADISAAQLTGDPAGLASALVRLEQYQRTITKDRILPGHRGAEPSLLRTHPTTAERVRRLQDVAGEAREAFFHDGDARLALSARLAQKTGRPRRRMSGLWY